MVIIRKQFTECNRKNNRFRKCKKVHDIDIEWVLFRYVDEKCKRNISFFLDRNGIFSDIEYRFGIIVVGIVVDIDAVWRWKYMNIDNPERLEKSLFGNIFRTIEETFVIRIISLKKEIQEHGHNSHDTPKYPIFILMYANFFLIGRNHFENYKL